MTAQQAPPTADRRTLKLSRFRRGTEDDVTDVLPAHRGAEAMVEVENVDFSYGSVQVLFDVSLTVAPGELLALLGTNGAGKSTLLRVLAGLARPDAGRVWLDGQDVTGTPAAVMVEKGLALLPGGKAVFADMPVRENLDVAGYPLRHDSALRAEREAEVLELFPRLSERMNVLAGKLSGGEQQQLALAKCLLLRPRVLCIDELSLGLAPVTVEALLEAVTLINERGTTVVLVEQSLSVAASICPRAVFMEKGAIRFEGPTQDLLERSDIARAVFFGGGAAAADSAPAPAEQPQPAADLAPADEPGPDEPGPAEDPAPDGGRRPRRRTEG